MTRMRGLGLVLCSVMCADTALHADECSKWLAQYRAQIQRRADAKRLASAKHRLVSGRKRTPGPNPSLHRAMSPLEALRRYQIDCGDVSINVSVGPEIPLLPLDQVVVDTPPEVDTSSWTAAPEFDYPTSPDVEVAQDVPTGFLPGGLTAAFPAPFPVVAPVVLGPSGGSSSPVASTPEPDSWILIVSGLLILLIRRIYAAR